MASNLGELYCRAINGWFLLLLLEVRDDYILVGLMRALEVIVLRELFTDMVEVIAAEDYEMIEAFLLYCLNEPFHESAGVGGSKRGDLDFGLLACKRLVEGFGELRIAVMHQQFEGDFLFFDVLLERLCLLKNPRFIRVICAWGNEDSPGFDMQKCDGK